ncbi:892_t:CDS:2, partial [Funneliformis geosporum]
DILALQNSTDLKLLTQAQEKQKELQKLLDDTVNLLGPSDIKNLTDLRNLLKETKYQTLTEEKDEEIEAQIIKQTELEELRKGQQKELKKEIDTQQKELIERTREI